MSTFVPLRIRLLGVAVIATTVGIVVVRGRDESRVRLKDAVLAATNGSFYHWRLFGPEGLRQEGWCAQRRERTLTYQNGMVIAEVRRSPVGVYRAAKGDRPDWKPIPQVGMEQGRDFLTQEAARLDPPRSAILRRGPEGKYPLGDALLQLEPRTGCIVRIERPGRWAEIDYPEALNTDLFSPPR